VLLKQHSQYNQVQVTAKRDQGFPQFPSIVFLFPCFDMLRKALKSAKLQAFQNYGFQTNSNYFQHAILGGIVNVQSFPQAYFQFSFRLNKHDSSSGD
jgi:hypothetical protein